MEYTVVDIETADKGLKNNRITEICIVRMDGDQVIDKFVSLVNPGRRIPGFITGLTGIDDVMVRDAPLFEEIAGRIVEITEGAVFVAHNVKFDYTVLRSEFRYLGYEFKRQKLCTVRLAKKLMPGMFSYSLGKLCSSLGIPLVNRHRAEGDADATVVLFQRLMSLDSDGMVFDAHLNGRRNSTGITFDKNIVSKLPQSPGVYFFKNAKGRIIYVGKAVRIKERVLSHFYSKNTKEHELCGNTVDVDYLETGNELIALLMEADEIQRHYPKYNVLQKKLRRPYCIISYTDQKGILQFALDRKTALDLGTETYWRREEAIERLKAICKDFELCPKFSGLQRIKGSCSHYQIRDCQGICQGSEAVDSYNERAFRAMDALCRTRKDYAIVGKGRSDTEHGFVLVTGGIYRGFGFFGREESIHDPVELENFLIRKKNTYHTTRIISSYLNANPDTMKLMVPENV